MIVSIKTVPKFFLAKATPVLFSAILCQRSYFLITKWSCRGNDIWDSILKTATKLFWAKVTPAYFNVSLYQCSYFFIDHYIMITWNKWRLRFPLFFTLPNWDFHFELSKTLSKKCAKIQINDGKWLICIKLPK